MATFLETLKKLLRIPKNLFNLIFSHPIQPPMNIPIPLVLSYFTLSWLSPVYFHFNPIFSH